MTVTLWIHIAGGTIALLAGVAAIVARKGGRIHGAAGVAFAVSILVLGMTAGVIDGEFVGNLGVCYFVATGWVAARRRDGTTGRFEIVACVVAVVIAVRLVWLGATIPAVTPAGSAPLYGQAAVCLFASLADLKAIISKPMTPAQRLSRHLWRMCTGFFMATAAFFLGQQKVLPEVIHGSPVLFVLAFAPFGVMTFWLVRLRFKKVTARLAARI